MSNVKEYDLEKMGVKVGNTTGKNTADSIMEKIAEGQKHRKYEKSFPGITERFMYDVEEYLRSRIPIAVPDCDIKEMATYCANRFTVSMSDVLIDRDNEWKKLIDRERRQYDRVLRRTKRRESED